MLAEWEKALKSDDPRDANRFLWQHCQDFIETVKRQRFVIDLLNDVIDDKDAKIAELEELLTIDRYGD
jgi:hypothetical protein